MSENEQSPTNPQTEARKELLMQYPILQFFSFEHLKDEKLKSISGFIAQVAYQMAGNLPRNAETSAGLRHLLEAKDAFVRAAIYKDPTKG